MKKAELGMPLENISVIGEMLTQRASEDVLFGNRHANRQGSWNPFLQPVHSQQKFTWLHMIYKELITIYVTKLHHNFLIYNT